MTNFMDDKLLTSKQKEQMQLRADVEAFLQNGGKIVDLPPGMSRRDASIAVPEEEIEEIEEDGDL